MLPAIPGITSGELVKFKIEALRNRDDRQAIDTFEAMYNPNTYSQKLNVETTLRSEPGRESECHVFNRLGPQSYTFEFLLDGTGASSPTIPGGVGLALPGAEALLKPPEVSEMVEKFTLVCYGINRESHHPNYLRLSWGTFLDICTLQSAEVKYTLFKPDGKPLRARITATFNRNTATTSKVQSADLTHIRAVNEGDNLPLMADKIYEKPDYYIQLAQANKLKNFRRLNTGKNLTFPPLRNVSE